MSSEETNADLKKARELIQQKRYDEAESILIFVDHPTADKWLQKLQTIKSGTVSQKQKESPSSAQQQRAASQDYTTKLVVSIVLLFFFAIPGIIATSIFARQAERDMKLARTELPGAKALIFLNRFVFWLIAIPAILMITAMVIGVLGIMR